MKMLYGLCVGGPKDGEKLEAPDTAKARNANYLPMINESGERFIYVRDPTDYPDGVTRWVWMPEQDMLRELKSLTPGTYELGDDDAGKEERKLSQRGRIRANWEKNRMEVYIDGELAETKPMDDFPPTSEPEARLKAIQAWAREWGDEAQ